MARLRTRLKRKAARAQSRTSGVTNPTSTTYCHQAIELSRQGRSAEAETHLREALRLWPNDIDLLNELGLTIWRQGRAAEAEEIYRRAYRIKPDDFRILANLGVALHEQDQFDEASEFCRRAIQFNPNAFDAHMNLGVNLSDQGKFDEATVWLERAHQLRPDSADIYLNLGMNLLRQGRIDEAIDQYEQGLRLQPEFARLHRNLAHALLCRGDYERGWQEHEWRMKCDDYPGRRINRPFWNGENFPDRTILLHHEQGFGDTLQLIRFAPLVKSTRSRRPVGLSTKTAPAGRALSGGRSGVRRLLVPTELSHPYPLIQFAGAPRHDAIHPPRPGPLSRERSRPRRALALGAGAGDRYGDCEPS